MENEIILKIKNVDKSFHIDGIDQKVLENIDLTVTKEKFVCLIGPSGCGKSTLLRIATDLMSHDTGSVNVAPGTKFSFVFQNFALFPWLNVSDNIGFGLKMAGVNKKKISDDVTARIAQIGLTGFENKHPKELSGGMKQRVGIARALSMEPDLLLLDEPFSALDTFTANNLRQDLLEIWKNSKITIMMVSHLIEEAVELADNVVVFDTNPGRVKEVVNIDLPRPRDKRSAEFFAYVDRLSALIIADEKK